jgi:hypothetical protein
MARKAQPKSSNKRYFIVDDLAKVIHYGPFNSFKEGGAEWDRLEAEWVAANPRPKRKNLPHAYPLCLVPEHDLDKEFKFAKGVKRVKLRLPIHLTTKSGFNVMQYGAEVEVDFASMDYVGRIDYTDLEKVFDLRKGVPVRLFDSTRLFMRGTPEKILPALQTMLNNTPKTFTALSKLNFTRNFVKALFTYVGDLQAAINAVQQYVDSE